jgi:hypothetical protein
MVGKWCSSVPPHDMFWSKAPTTNDDSWLRTWLTAHMTDSVRWQKNGVKNFTAEIYCNLQNKNWENNVIWKLLFVNGSWKAAFKVSGYNGNWHTVLTTICNSKMCNVSCSMKPVGKWAQYWHTTHPQHTALHTNFWGTYIYCWLLPKLTPAASSPTL